MTEDQIRNILKKYDSYVRRNSRSIQCDETYFDVIDTEEKAYFLGIMYSDGCNTKEGLVVTLCEPDQYLLSAFAKAIGSSTKLRLERKRKVFHKSKYRLAIYSTKISRSLTKQGCIPRKSLVLKFPNLEQVPEHLMSHFLRGVFDGDGSIYFSEKKLGVSITGSPFFCQGAQEFIEKRLNAKPCLESYSHSLAKNIKLSTRGAIVFLDYLYSDATVKMARKYEKFILYLRQYQPVNVGGAAFPTEIVAAIRDKWLNLTPCPPPSPPSSSPLNKPA